MEFKEILKIQRAKLGLTLEDIARHVGVSSATVSRWEKGEIENVRRDKIAKLSEILMVTPSYLMGWIDDPYNYDLDPDSRLASIPKERFEHLMSVYNGHLPSVWEAHWNMSADEFAKASKYFVPAERGCAFTETEEEMLLLARHLEPIPEEERKKLVGQLKSFADLYLQKVLPQEDE